MLICFFFNGDSVQEELVTTYWLSQNSFDGPSIGMPSIRNLYLNRISISVAIFKAMSSEPNVDVSTVFCRFKNHTIGAFYHNMISELPCCPRDLHRQNNLTALHLRVFLAGLEAALSFASVYKSLQSTFINLFFQSIIALSNTNFERLCDLRYANM